MAFGTTDARDVAPGRSRVPWLAAGCILLLLPSDAWAWGPVTHVAIGRSVLDAASLLPAAVAAILYRYRGSYLYGCIAADIVFAKRLSKVKQFCHHWSTAYGLLEVAGSDRDRAFAYGYLSHLAADTVAHGKFVPRQVLMSGTSVSFGHLFWELRADAVQAGAPQAELKELIAADQDDHHAALARRITDTFLPYDFNRIVFDRMNALAAHEAFRRRVDRWGKSLKGRLSGKLLRAYGAECVDRTLAVLTEGRRCALLREDPNGTSALMQLRVQRRDLRRMRRRGLSVARRLKESSKALAPAEPSFPRPT